jgi:tetratricopeptide (TPR) repeat protein
VALTSSGAQAEKLRSAQILEKARKRFQAGQEAYEQGRYEAALHDFQESHRLSKNPILYFNMAACEERLDHQQAAALLLHQYLSENPKAEDRVQVENRIRVLDERDEQIKKEPSTAPPAEVAPTPAAVAAPVSTPAVAPPSKTGGSRFRAAWAGLGVTAGIGLAAIGVGAYAVADHGDLKASCGQTGCSSTQINGLRSATVATDVLIGVTGAAAITTVILFIVEARRGHARDTGPARSRAAYDALTWRF